MVGLVVGRPDTATANPSKCGITKTSRVIPYVNRWHVKMSGCSRYGAVAARAAAGTSETAPSTGTQAPVTTLSIWNPVNFNWSGIVDWGSRIGVTVTACAAFGAAVASTYETFGLSSTWITPTATACGTAIGIQAYRVAFGG